jgi:ribosomal protein S27AE
VADKKVRARAARRQLERQAEKLSRARERLADLEAGGSAERPIEITSASQVEVEARARRCPRCDGELRVDEHGAETIGNSRLRVARVSCPRCGAQRAIYFRLSALPS